MLKILAGQDKGRSIETVPSPSVRPILARVKKSLFDIIRPRMPGARFLDIFAGSGAVGLEALSRGASSAVFLEYDNRCVRVLHDNLEKLKRTAQASVIRVDVAISGLGQVKGPFDIIFMGPPYKDAQKAPLALVTPAVAQIGQFSLLAPNGLVVAQHHKKEPVTAPDDTWDLFRVEQYGDTWLSFFRKKSQ